jgi:hypothetical protein
MLLNPGSIPVAWDATPKNQHEDSYLQCWYKMAISANCEAAKGTLTACIHLRV